MLNIYCIRPMGFNIGNEVIFLAMEHFLAKAFGRVVNVISMPATSRYRSGANAGLTSRAIYEINQYGHAVIVGGGNLYENGELDVNLDALETLDVPLMLFGLSAGRVYNRRLQLVRRTDAMPDRVITQLNRKSKLSLVRDNATGEFLDRLGTDGVIVGGCPTLFLNRAVDRLPKLDELDKSPVVISIRNPSLMNVPPEKQAKVYGDIWRIIEFLQGEGMQDIRLLCHDHRDIAFASSFSGIEYVYTDDVHTYLTLLRSCALNVSYRLHSALPCLSFGRPVIKISYDERALSMMDTIGLGDWNIDMVRSNDVINQVIDRYHRLDDLVTLCAQEQPQWDRFYGLMSDAFATFATEVRLYQASFDEKHTNLRTD